MLFNLVKTLVICFCLSFFGTNGVAEDHVLGTLSGTNIDMKEYDHAIAGSIKDFVAFGNVDEATATSTLTIKKDGQVITAIFKEHADGRFGGEFSHVAHDKTFVTAIYFDKLDKATQAFHLKLNGEAVVVKITAPNFENNHFFNPTYTTTYKGETISYTLSGPACYRYSVQLSFLVLSAYTH